MNATSQSVAPSATRYNSGFNVVSYHNVDSFVAAWKSSGTNRIPTMGDFFSHDDLLDFNYRGGKTQSVHEISEVGSANKQYMILDINPDVPPKFVGSDEV